MPAPTPAAALKKSKDAHPELTVELPDRLKYPEFAQLLRRTKLFISPWGCALSP